MKIDRIDILGIILIFLGIFIFFTGFLDELVVMITWPLLSGSSEGKAVLFFLGMGSLLILNSLIKSRRGVLDKIGLKLENYSPDGRKYLKMVIILVLLTYAAGIILEIFIRLKYGVSPLTLFVSLNPNPASTSPMHSHVFKSVLGYLVSLVGFNIPIHIHTGGSLIQQVTPGAFLILFTLPAAYITGLLSLDNRRDAYRLIMAFSITLTLVGMLDGGLFSQPGLIGLAGILGMHAIKSPFKPRQLLIPTILIALLIVTGVALETVGSNSDYHELTIINPHLPLDLQGYTVISMQEKNDRTIIRIKADRSDKETIESLFVSLKGKADGFFMTWNFASYFD
ncbi:MAG: hypothetical protein Q8M92_06095 [Candidatus Subteraquimicrobiales bacterium]|nr:hypothetical protein [Candidatus Subteraquimicrobiales bacterium]